MMGKLISFMVGVIVINQKVIVIVINHTSGLSDVVVRFSYSIAKYPLSHIVDLWVTRFVTLLGYIILLPKVTFIEFRELYLRVVVAFSSIIVIFHLFIVIFHLFIVIFHLFIVIYHLIVITSVVVIGLGVLGMRSYFAVIIDWIIGCARVIARG